MASYGNMPFSKEIVKPIMKISKQIEWLQNNISVIFASAMSLQQL
jgi:hypothetical protein